MGGEVAEARFDVEAPVVVPDKQLTSLPLVASSGAVDGVQVVDGHLTFATIGWFEVLLSVAWDPTATRGTRFAHSKIPGQQPLHSEAIEASVLALISDGRQLLRGNTVFGHDHTNELILEVWHDARQPVRVKEAQLVVRELVVPWSPG
jgi:hypothetical protein